jgi:hypothetical protein
LSHPLSAKVTNTEKNAAVRVWDIGGWMLMGFSDLWNC